MDSDGKVDLNEDGDAISEWKDRSGNNKEVKQTATSAKPVYMSSQAGDKAGILFDGNGDFLFVMGALAEDGGDSSLYVVHQRKVEGGDDGGIVLDEATAEIASVGKTPYAIKVSSIQQVGATQRISRSVRTDQSPVRTSAVLSMKSWSTARSFPSQTIRRLKVTSLTSGVQRIAS